nr:hypothetical protein [uncultured Actinoplanes sp.]
MRHLAARVTAALALVAACLAGAAPAHAGAPGFTVRMGQAPATFTTGKAARPLTAVVSTRRDLRRCLKVRWTLIVRAQGVSLDQIRVSRVEEGGTFAVQARVVGDAARITDSRPDPGELCRDRTVTGRWDVSFTGPDDGSVTFEARAVEGARVLSSASTTSRVVTPVAAKRSASPSASPSPSVTEEAAEEAEPPQAVETSADPVALNPASGTPSVLGPGLIVGAVLVFLGVALLLRIRSRNRRRPAWQSETQQLPTGFYDMPGRRRR